MKLDGVSISMESYQQLDIDIYPNKEVFKNDSKKVTFNGIPNSRLCFWRIEFKDVYRLGLYERLIISNINP